ALPSLEVRARSGGAGHAGLRARRGGPPSPPPRGVEPQGGRHPLLPRQAPPLRRGLRAGGAGAAPRRAAVQGDAAPLRDAGRARPVAQEPLLSDAAVRAAGAVLPLPLLRAARHPRRSERVSLPLPAGVLVPADRG